MMIWTDLPVTELCEQTPGDASLHDYTATSVFDTLHLPGFMEQRDQSTLLIGKPNKNGRICFIKLFLNHCQQILDSAPVQSGNSYCLGKFAHYILCGFWVAQLI